MSRILAATALAFGLAAAPALAQTPLSPDESRTMQQNQSVTVYQTRLPSPVVAPQPPSKPGPAASLPPVTTRSMAIADRSR